MLESIKTGLIGIITFVFQLEPVKLAIIFFFLAFVWLIMKAHKAGKLDWTDLITSKGTNKVSLTKFLQLIGGITGTWIMIYQTTKGDVQAELFLTYLAYVGAIEGWSKFVSARYGVGNGSSQQTIDYSSQDYDPLYRGKQKIQPEVPVLTPSSIERAGPTPPAGKPPAGVDID